MVNVMVYIREDGVQIDVHKTCEVLIFTRVFNIVTQTNSIIFFL